MPKIRTIPATKPLHARPSHDQSQTRRVAAYARVSTDHEEQLTSYQAQIDYYTSYIGGRSDWEFVKVYADEGISGTTTNRREGFKSMIADALDGKIDLIITKSVSRFARNTVDSLTTIRKLKDHHVECYFEKESIWTFDGKGELLITIMSSIAQEESRSISENVTWSKRKQAKAGKVSVAYGQFLGYDRGPDGKFKINEEQAEVVKLIYSLFLQGKSPNNICTILTEQGIPTPGGKTKWGDQCVAGILQNEKYIGDALLQKRYTVDYLTHKLKVNEGEVPQYYIEENHEPIISKEVFDLVQAEMERRKGMTGRRSTKRMLAGRVRCAQCGSWFSKKTWHPNTPQEKVVWQCGGKYDKSHPQCTSGNLTKHEIQIMFMIAINKLLDSSSDILETQKLIYNSMFDTSSLEKERQNLIAEMKITMELMNRVQAREAEEEIMEETDEEPEAAPFDAEYGVLLDRYTFAKHRKKELEETIEDKKSKKVLATEFFEKLSGHKGPVSKFNIDLWNGLLDHIDVHHPDDVRFIFRDGSEIMINMPEEEKKQQLTPKQREQIARYRREGLTYNKIAKKMDLTQGKVRSFCLSRVNNKVNSSTVHPGYCKTCGKELIHNPGYRKKMFCSDGCRRDWWNRKENIKPGAKRAPNAFVCQNCGKTFYAYGKDRKYCNKHCYLESRWKKEEPSEKN